MVWVVVRTYGNGSFINSIYPIQFKYLSKAQNCADELNKKEGFEGFSDKWIPLPLYSEDSVK